MSLLGGISKTKNNMDEIRIIPEYESLDIMVKNFRTECLNLDVKNTSTAGIFLMNLEKFEKVWDTIISDIDNENLFTGLLKQTWVDIIKQKRVVVIHETNIKKLVDIL
jgi:hypothetical protein